MLGAEQNTFTHQIKNQHSPSGNLIFSASLYHSPSLREVCSLTWESSCRLCILRGGSALSFFLWCHDKNCSLSIRGAASVPGPSDEEERARASLGWSWLTDGSSTYMVTHFPTGICNAERRTTARHRSLFLRTVPLLKERKDFPPWTGKIHSLMAGYGGLKEEGRGFLCESRENATNLGWNHGIFGLQ